MIMLNILIHGEWPLCSGYGAGFMNFAICIQFLLKPKIFFSCKSLTLFSQAEV